MAAAPETSPDPPLRIVAYTRGQLVAEPRLLATFEDPHGYLRGCDASGIQRLADNPHGRDDDLALILAADGRTVVGRLGFFAGPAPVDSPEPTLLWLSGFFLQERYRSTGAGGMLMLRALSARRQLLAAGGPSPELQKLYDSTGYLRLPRLRGFFWFYDPAPLLARYIATPGLRAAVRPLARAALWLYGSIRRARVEPGVTFTRCSQFDPWVDALMAADNAVVFRRDHALLNWILKHSRTTTGYEISRNGRRIGYCILGERKAPVRSAAGAAEPAVTWGVLVDYYLVPAEQGAVYDIVAFARQRFADGTASVLFCQGSSAALADACRKLGLVEYGGSHVFYRPGNRYRFDAARPMALTGATADVSLMAD